MDADEVGLFQKMRKPVTWAGSVPTVHESLLTGIDQMVSASALLREMLGEVHVQGDPGSRNGAGQLLPLYTAIDQTLSFQVEIDPFALPPSGSSDAFSCGVSAVIQGGIADPLPIGEVPDNPALLEYYCEPSPTGKRHDVDIAEDPATVNRTLTSAVFYCRLEGGTHSVTIAKTPTGIRRCRARAEPERTAQVPAGK